MQSNISGAPRQHYEGVLMAGQGEDPNARYQAQAHAQAQAQSMGTQPPHPPNQVSQTFSFGPLQGHGERPRIYGDCLNNRSRAKDAFNE